jgi:hypothetical protein
MALTQESNLSSKLSGILGTCFGTGQKNKHGLPRLDSFFPVFRGRGRRPEMGFSKQMIGRKRAGSLRDESWANLR